MAAISRRRRSAAGSSLDHVLKLGVFVADVAEWPRVNAVCAGRFGDHRPARIVVPCGPMRYGSRIEIDAIAATKVKRKGTGK
jgi:2-iminobutanoate/2-iminopropanoate deaminase